MGRTGFASRRRYSASPLGELHFMSLNNKLKVRSFVSYTQPLLAGVIGALVSVTAHGADITGAGSTFAAPIYTE
jgi:hypothetical protein